MFAAKSRVTVYVAIPEHPGGHARRHGDREQLAEKQEVERKNVTPGAISGPEQIEDPVAAQTIYAGEQVTTRRFKSDSKRGLRAELTGNMRALRFPVTRSSC